MLGSWFWYMLAACSPPWIGIARAQVAMQEDVLTPSTASSASFGDVDIDGDTLVLTLLGTPKVFVYRLHAHAWELEQEVLAPSGATASFGVQVRVDEDTIAVGDPAYVAAGVHAGAVVCYQRSQATWTLDTLLTPSAPATGQLFGLAIALDSEHLAVGAPQSNGSSGTAFVYVRAGATWSLLQTIDNPDGSSNADEFAQNVDLDESYLLINARLATVAGRPAAGRAHLYELRSGAWVGTNVFTHPTPASNDWFSDRVRIDYPFAAFSVVFRDHPSAANAGSVYVFEHAGGVWTALGEVFDPAPVADELFGGGLGLRDGWLTVGAPWRNSTGLCCRAGRGFTYELPSLAPSAVVPTGLSSGDEAARGIETDGQRIAVVSPGESRGYVFDLPDSNRERYAFGQGCPCANDTWQAQLQGCANSTGRGGVLTLVGSASRSSNDLTAVAFNLAPHVAPFVSNANPLLFSGTVAVNGGLGVPTFEGRLAVGGTLKRIRRMRPDAGTEARWTLDLSSASVGQSIHYQAIFRDVSSGACPSITPNRNYTTAARVTVTP